NVWGALHLAREMLEADEPGSIVTLLCDGGERYGRTCFDDAWVGRAGLDLVPDLAVLNELLR
ncbi:MAG: PLP-dependent cysteine synthase family protein, partial [Actinomycetota bacterium]|nr:PLP-dependent cysteine synthase family protein [Actinomycetota bacterium]